MLTKQEAEAVLMALDEVLDDEHRKAFVSALRKLKAMAPETHCDAFEEWGVE